MSYNSLKYFLEKSYSDTQGIIGYFDFTDNQISGSSIISGNSFNNEDYLSLLISNPSVFWSKSGTSRFNGDTYYSVSGNLLNNFFSMIVFNAMDSGRENTLFSSYGNNDNNYSGFTFGISKYGYPYIKYYDNLLGHTYFSHSEPINSNRLGIYYFGLNSANKFFIGTYSFEDDSVLEESCSWNIDYNISNNIYIGGGSGIDSNKYFSGHLDELLIYENNTFESIDKNILVSGIVYDIVDTVTTGIISGQTGILYGDIISIKECSVLISGQTGILFQQAYTGIEYYVPSYDEFFDFNNESFSNYYYSGFSGQGFKSSVYQTTGETICSNSITGYTFYEYDSGYKIEYEIKNKSIILRRPEYLYYIYNGIKFNFSLLSGDSIYILYQNPNLVINNKTNYKLTNYNYEIDTFVDANAQYISGLYFNGQYQRNSTGYTYFLLSGYKYFMPSNDFIINNNFIFSNEKRFLPPEFVDNSLNSYLISDLWLDSGENYFLTTGISSGNALLGANFINSIVFLNGQLLISGEGFEIPNKILFNISSGDNLISVHKINGPFEKYSFKNNIDNQNIIYLNDNFVENSAAIWLNGIRQINGLDYVEI